MNSFTEEGRIEKGDAPLTKKTLACEAVLGVGGRLIPPFALAVNQVGSVRSTKHGLFRTFPNLEYDKCFTSCSRSLRFYLRLTRTQNYDASFVLTCLFSEMTWVVLTM